MSKEKRDYLPQEDWERTIERLTGEFIPYDREFYNAWLNSRLPLRPFIAQQREWADRLKKEKERPYHGPYCVCGACA